MKISDNSVYEGKVPTVFRDTIFLIFIGHKMKSNGTRKSFILFRMLFNIIASRKVTEIFTYFIVKRKIWFRQTVLY